MSLGINISKIRINSQISQRQLAQDLGVSAGAVGLWETGKRLPDANMIIKIANYFNVSTDYLLGLSPDLTSTQEDTYHEQLSDDEAKLLNTYRSLGTDEKQIILGKALDLKLSSSVDIHRKKDIG